MTTEYAPASVSPVESQSWATVVILNYRGLWKWYPLGLISQDWGFESLTRYQYDIASPLPASCGLFYAHLTVKNS